MKHFKTIFFAIPLLFVFVLAGCSDSNPESSQVKNLKGTQSTNSTIEEEQDFMEQNGMMGKNHGETFSESTEGLPDVVPTHLVKLKDGDTFEMTAEMVKQEVGNRVVKRLAYNRMIPGPVIEVEKDAKLNIKFTNKLDVETTLHSHGLRVDDDFDGVPIEMGGKQENMQPGESFTYEITFPDTGVFWYHPHIREDYTQEMGLYGNYNVTEEGYWNPVDREEFLVLDDFSENDPFYKDLTNKTLMGRFGNILLINNQENFQMKVKTGEQIRFYVTNTANTRTFDFSIKDQKLKIVGGDIGRVEKEYLANDFIIAPAERVIFETQFQNSGTYEIQHRGEKIGEILAEGENQSITSDVPLRENPEDYSLIREDFQRFLEAPIDKNLRLTIEMGMMGESNGMGVMMGHDEDKIEWEDTMPQMNRMSNNQVMKWVMVDETDPKNPKKNIEMNEDWRFTEGDLVKIKIFNDPDSAHPMQHPIHFHGQRFVVLSRDGVPNDNLQWKDTTLIQKGETVEILVEMSNPGKWIAHCHIAEHMHAGMMFNFEVIKK